MDFLNFVIALHKTLGVEIPEEDYPKLASLNGCLAYLTRADASRVDPPGDSQRRGEEIMKTVISRSAQPISLKPMFDAKGLILTIHGSTPEANTVTYLSLQEARLLAYELLAEAERQQ
ncbi:hypothetical protein [Nitrospira sp. Kam-Ns4a]